MSDDKKKAAVAPDDLTTKKVADLTAHEFVSMLHGMYPALGGHWGDKKKLELWTHPEGGGWPPYHWPPVGWPPWGPHEKKKVEREVPPDLSEEFLEKLASRVAAKLEKK